MSFFRKTENTKLLYKDFITGIVLSAMTIFACVAAMFSSALAFFHTNITTDNSSIEGAYYSVVVDNAVNGMYICPLTFDDLHVFKITADGTATTGYCKIQIGDSVYYTKQIPQEKSLELPIYAAKGTVIYFEPLWGEHDGATCDDTINYSHTPYAEYTAEATAKLTHIAVHYGVSEEDIKVYNNITCLEAGTKIRIPGVSSDAEPYRVPYEVYTVQKDAILENIAEYYGISVQDILMFNGITEIYEGFELRLPGASPELAPYSVPEKEEQEEQQEQEEHSPTDDTPTDDTPTDDTPTDDTPTDDTTADDTPTDDTTADDTPTDDTTAEDIDSDEIVSDSSDGNSEILDKTEELGQTGDLQSEISSDNNEFAPNEALSEPSPEPLPENEG